MLVLVPCPPGTGMITGGAAEPSVVLVDVVDVVRLPRIGGIDADGVAEF